MKIIIAGSRGFDNYQLLKYKVDKILTNVDQIEIVSGGAKGADLLGEKYAQENNYTLTQIPAEWDYYGKKAGYIRNQQMADYADGCICFWDGKSKGTKHMIDIAKEKGLKLRVVNFNNYKI